MSSMPNLCYFPPQSTKQGLGVITQRETLMWKQAFRVTPLCAGLCQVVHFPRKESCPLSAQQANIVAYVSSISLVPCV